MALTMKRKREALVYDAGSEAESSSEGVDVAPGVPASWSWQCLHTHVCFPFRMPGSERGITTQHVWWRRAT